MSSVRSSRVSERPAVSFGALTVISVLPSTTGVSRSSEVSVSSLSSSPSSRQKSQEPSSQPQPSQPRRLDLFLSNFSSSSCFLGWSSPIKEARSGFTISFVK
ncbi:hypothetical protein FOQG_13343 [Fusarium oxysporum f. sp. raphani 54005]|uniref:Uncharacterized protein n=1 Tax=Fusarium oxysporum f. sp. raphani 54005 TaxID=1089458 RepID=X0BUY6_FUSOX|nr:hypothetical protein FOQG_13343 [Fusarium oxysporum f. sp. raphani 54005]